MPSEEPRRKSFPLSEGTRSLDPFKVGVNEGEPLRRERWMSPSRNCQPFSTFAAAYERRARSCADSWKQNQLARNSCISIQRLLPPLSYSHWNPHSSFYYDLSRIDRYPGSAASFRLMEASPRRLHFSSDRELAQDGMPVSIS